MGGLDHEVLKTREQRDESEIGDGEQKSSHAIGSNCQMDTIDQSREDGGIFERRSKES